MSDKITIELTPADAYDLRLCIQIAEQDGAVFMAEVPARASRLARLKQIGDELNAKGARKEGGDL